MGGLFGGGSPKDMIQDTSAQDAVERRNLEKERAAQRSIKARQRATTKGGPLLESMQNFANDKPQLTTTLGPKKKPT
jgi:hypothetical protein